VGFEPTSDRDDHCRFSRPRQNGSVSRFEGDECQFQCQSYKRLTLVLSVWWGSKVSREPQEGLRPNTTATPFNTRRVGRDPGGLARRVGEWCRMVVTTDETRRIT
jgi:hypothetical protein